MRSVAETDDNGSDVAKFSFQTIPKIIGLKIRSYRRYGENGRGSCLFVLFMRLHAPEPVLHIENCQHADQKQLT